MLRESTTRPSVCIREILGNFQTNFYDICSGKFEICRFFSRTYRADNSLARPGRKQARKHDRDVRDFNQIKARAVIKFLFLQGKAPKEIHAILTETLAYFLPGRAKDLSVPLYQSLFVYQLMNN